VPEWFKGAVLKTAGASAPVGSNPTPSASRPPAPSPRAIPDRRAEARARVTGMKRVLLTGMSGTGKSTVIRRLSALGFKAVDTDDDWPRWVTPARDPESAHSEPDWLWREDLIEHLLCTQDAEVLFVSGCRSNQSEFYPQFDHIVLLTAAPSVIVERLATRSTNDYGKRAEELAQVLRNQEEVEPLLRRAASLEIDTSAPLDEVVQRILRVIQPPASA
jgi:dephospho-CoA kinase